MSENEKPESPSTIHSENVHDFHTFPQKELADATAAFRPVEPAKPRPFVLATCLERVRKGMPTPPGDNVYPRWDYSSWHDGWLGVPGSLSREEAHFWFAAATSRIRLTDALPGDATVDKLASGTYDGALTIEQATEELTQFWNTVTTTSVSWYASEIGWVALCLRELFGVSQTAKIALEAVPLNNRYSYIDNLGSPYSGPDGETEEQKLLEIVGAHVASLDISDYTAMGLAQKLLHRAPHQGQVRRILDGIVGNKASRYGYHEQVFDIIYALDTPEEYFHYLGRFDASLTSREIMRLIARTGFEHVSWLLERALKHGRGWSKKSALPTLLQIHSTAMAPTMLELSLASSLSASRELATPCEQWLLDEGANAVAGLLPLAISRGKLREPALAMLRRIRDRGHGDMVMAEIDRMPAKAQPALREALTAPTPEQSPTSDLADWPTWITSLKRVDTGVAFLADDALPRLKTVEGSLAPIEVTHALLSRLSLEDIPEHGAGYKRSARLAELLSKIDPSSGADFAVELIDAFYKAQEPKEQHWCLRIVTCFADERVLLAYEPHLRTITFRVRGSSSEELTLLRILGTPEAVSLLADLAHTHKEDRVRSISNLLLTAIEKERDLDEESLLDECVSHCQLDASSSYRFDYGAHTYRLVVRGVGDWTIVDQAGHLLRALPTPRTEDDLAKVDVARAQYRQLVGHLGRTFTGQLARFEKAMIDGRFWHAGTWRKNILGHPVLTHFARTLIWGIRDANGALTATFRAAEDGSLADHDDAELTLSDDADLVVAHPLFLADDVRAQWAQQLADYKVVQPFVQVGRAIFRHGAEAPPGSRTYEIDAAALVTALKPSGWHPAKSDNWRYTHMRREFERQGFGADIAVDPGFGNDTGKGYGTMKIGTVQFFRGKPERGKPLDEVKLGDVPDLVFSEVQMDLQRALESGGTK